MRLCGESWLKDVNQLSFAQCDSMDHFGAENDHVDAFTQLWIPSQSDPKWTLRSYYTPYTTSLASTNSSRLRFFPSNGGLIGDLKGNYVPHFHPVAVSHPAYRLQVGFTKDLPNIYVLILDSASSVSMSHFAPRLHQYIRENFVSLDFFGPVSPGGTRAALFPLLYGGLNPDCELLLGASFTPPRLLDFHQLARECSAGNRRLFKIARAVGYRTAFIEMTGSSAYVLRSDVDNFFPTIPPTPESALFGHMDTQCLGGTRGFQHVLQFTERFYFEAEPAWQPKFAITHLSAAHETPAALQMLQSSVEQHLRSFVERDPQSLIIVMSDHGRAEINCDYRRPILAIRAPTRNPGWTQSLHSHENQTVSVWDIYTTIRFVLQGTAFKVDEIGLSSVLAMPLSAYDQPISFEASRGFQPVNLLFQSKQYRRTCMNAGIADVVCLQFDSDDRYEAWICSGHTESIRMESSSRLHRMGSPGLFTFCQQFMRVADEAVLYMNTRIQLTNCRQMQLAYVETVELDHLTGIYDVVFHVTLVSQMRIAAKFLFQLSNMDTYGVMSMKLVSFKQLTRFRKNEGCTPSGINPELCLCSEDIFTN